MTLSQILEALDSLSVEELRALAILLRAAIKDRVDPVVVPPEEITK